MNLLRYFFPSLGSNGGAFSPDLNNLEFWQGANDYDNNEVDNKVSGGDNAEINESNCLYFNGTDNYSEFTIGTVGSVVTGSGNISLTPVASQKHTIFYAVNGGTGFQFRINFDDVNTGTYLTIERAPTQVVRGLTSGISWDDYNNVNFSFSWDTATGVVDWTIGNTSGQHTGLTNVATPTGTTIKIGAFDPVLEPHKGNYYNLTFGIDGTTKAIFNFSEGSGSTIYDKSGNENHSTVAGTLTNIWATSNEQRPYNLENGFSNILIPDSVAVDIYQASSVAYGTWEFLNINTGDSGDRIELGFIDSDTDVTNIGGYRLRLHTTNQIDLIESGVAFLFSTSTNYFQDNTYYDIKITRNSILDEYYPGAIGTFAVYIRGGLFGNEYVLVDSATDNTITTSSYMNISFNSLSISTHLYAINIDDSRIDMTNFSNLSGTHSTPKLPASSVEPTKDVFENILTNPASSKLWNFSENKFAISISDDVITNGGFDTDSNWSKQGTWAISGGTANCTNTSVNSYIYQSTLDAGATYKITYTVVSLTSGTVGTLLGSYLGEIRSAPGTYVEYITTDGSTVGVGARSENTTAVIDNIKAVKIIHEDCQGILDHADYDTKLFTDTVQADGTNVGLRNTLYYSVAP